MSDKTCLVLAFILLCISALFLGVLIGSAYGECPTPAETEAEIFLLCKQDCYGQLVHDATEAMYYGYVCDVTRGLQLVSSSTSEFRSRALMAPYCVRSKVVRYQHEVWQAVGRSIECDE